MASPPEDSGFSPMGGNTGEGMLNDPQQQQNNNNAMMNMNMNMGMNNTGMNNMNQPGMNVNNMNMNNNKTYYIHYFESPTLYIQPTLIAPYNKVIGDSL